MHISSNLVLEACNEGEGIMEAHGDIQRRNGRILSPKVCWPNLEFMGGKIHYFWI